MFTIKQVLKRLGIAKPDTIYSLIRSGALRASNIAPNPNGRPCWRISEEAIQDFLAARQARPPVKTTRSRRKKQPLATQYF